MAEVCYEAKLYTSQWPGRRKREREREREERKRERYKEGGREGGGERERREMV
jgi:hypothetical protein